MGPLEIVLIIVCVAVVLGVIGAAIYRKVKGKPSGCGCGCEGCPHACHGKTKKKKKLPNKKKLNQPLQKGGGRPAAPRHSFAPPSAVRRV